jgi:hypothetical protein
MDNNKIRQRELSEKYNYWFSSRNGNLILKVEGLA